MLPAEGSCLGNKVDHQADHRGHVPNGLPDGCRMY